MTQLYLIGPFTQLLTMDKLPANGSLSDDVLEIIYNAGIVYADDIILNVGNFEALKVEYPNASLQLMEGNNVCLPGIIDAHTHICWAGSRANDYAMRLNGKSYLEIANSGGGIWDTVLKTRAASIEELTANTIKNADSLFRQGITTIEVKSGYGLNIEDELKMLRAIRLANEQSKAELIPTCLAAHIKPKDFEGNDYDYLKHLVNYLLPIVKKENLSNRVDIFVEASAFSIDDARYYLKKASALGFEITIHGDQFSSNSASLAIDFNARSIDHLEYADKSEIALLANSDTVPVALPGASIGLGDRFAPARKLLDQGCSLAIASDWNPGSAPMGNLLTQAAILGTMQKLSMSETWAALTCRAALALGKEDVGIIKKGMKADFIIFETDNFNEILYRQGELKPVRIIKSKK